MGYREYWTDSSRSVREVLQFTQFFTHSEIRFFSQIRPKIIFSVESVSYNMKIHDHLGKLKEVAEGLPDLEKVVVIPYCKKEEEISLDRLEMGDKACFFSKFVGSEEGECPPIEYVQVPFNHPLFIMYSSGTTGAPKCIVHGVGGTLMKHLEEHRIQGNRSEDDVLLYYTTIGWMMWNWMVSALALGTTLVLYDGSPLLPHPAALWDLVRKTTRVSNYALHLYPFHRLTS